MTLKQKQALLAYLGYYDGPLDGLWARSPSGLSLTSNGPTIQRNCDGAIAKVKRFAQYV